MLRSSQRYGRFVERHPDKTRVNGSVYVKLLPQWPISTSTCWCGRWSSGRQRCIALHSCWHKVLAWRLDGRTWCHLKIMEPVSDKIHYPAKTTMDQHSPETARTNMDRGQPSRTKNDLQRGTRTTETNTTHPWPTRLSRIEPGQARTKIDHGQAQTMKGYRLNWLMGYISQVNENKWWTHCLWRTESP